MEKQLRVIALVGSLRRESYTRRVVNALTMLAPKAMAIEMHPSVPCRCTTKMMMRTSRHARGGRSAIRCALATQYYSPPRSTTAPFPVS